MWIGLLLSPSGLHLDLFIPPYFPLPKNNFRFSAHAVQGSATGLRMDEGKAKGLLGRCASRGWVEGFGALGWGKVEVSRKEAMWG